MGKAITVDLLHIRVTANSVVLSFRSSQGRLLTKTYTPREFMNWAYDLTDQNAGTRLRGFRSMGMQSDGVGGRMVMSLDGGTVATMGNPSPAGSHGVCEDLTLLFHPHNQDGRNLLVAVVTHSAYTATNRYR